MILFGLMYAVFLLVCAGILVGTQKLSPWCRTIGATWIILMAVSRVISFVVVVPFLTLETGQEIVIVWNNVILPLATVMIMAAFFIQLQNEIRRGRFPPPRDRLAENRTMEGSHSLL